MLTEMDIVLCSSVVKIKDLDLTSNRIRVNRKSNYLTVFVHTFYLPNGLSNEYVIPNAHTIILYQFVLTVLFIMELLTCLTTIPPVFTLRSTDTTGEPRFWIQLSNTASKLTSGKSFKNV